MRCKGWILGVTRCEAIAELGEERCAGCAVIKARQREYAPRSDDRYSTSAFAGKPYDPRDHALPKRPPGSGGAS